MLTTLIEFIIVYLFAVADHIKSIGRRILDTRSIVDMLTKDGGIDQERIFQLGVIVPARFAQGRGDEFGGSVSGLRGGFTCSSLWGGPIL